jgi:preprotein translocase subunit SecG
MYKIDIHVCIISAIFFILGLLIHNFKMYYLLSGYNTLSKDKRGKIDMDKLTKILRNVFFIFSILLFCGMFIFQYFRLYKYYWTVYFPVIFFGMIIFLFAYGHIKKSKFMK